MNAQRWMAAVLVGASAAVFSSLPAAAAVVTNGSFEEDQLSTDTWLYAAHAWTAVGDSGTFNPPSAAYLNGAPFGHQVGFIQSGWGKATGVLEQTLDVSVVAGAEYHLAALIGRRLDNPLLPWEGYVMSLWAGDTLLASDDTSVDPGMGAFAETSIMARAVVGAGVVGLPLRIRFEAHYGQTDIDDVRLEIVPAPAGITLAAACAVRLLRRSRRRHQ